MGRRGFRNDPLRGSPQSVVSDGPQFVDGGQGSATGFAGHDDVGGVLGRFRETILGQEGRVVQLEGLVQFRRFNERRR